MAAVAPPLTRKLAHLVSLSAAEIEVLHEFQSAPRHIERSREVVVEGRKYDCLWVLLDGVAQRYRVLQDGRRQILNLILPGDFIGFPGCFFENALYSIGTLSDCTLSPIAFTRFLGLSATHPRLAAILFWSLSCEAAMYAEHLIGISRRSAVERIAHFLLELLTRLRVIGLADERSFQLPLTQEQIGDILGLTGVHVSRTLRQLREEGLVETAGQRITIRNAEQLSILADFERTYLNHFRMNEALLPDRPQP